MNLTNSIIVFKAFYHYHNKGIRNSSVHHNYVVKVWYHDSPRQNDIILLQSKYLPIYINAKPTHSMQSNLKLLYPHSVTWKRLLNENQSSVYAQTAKMYSMWINRVTWAEINSPALPIHEVWRCCDAHSAPGHSQCHFTWQRQCSNLDVLGAAMMARSLATTAASLAEEEVHGCGAACAAGCTLIVWRHAVMRGCRISHKDDLNYRGIFIIKPK